MKTSIFHLNDAQREGLAKVLDNVATALIAASILGYFVEHKVSLVVSIMLNGLALVLLFTATHLRGSAKPTPTRKPTNRRKSRG